MKPKIVRCSIKCLPVCRNRLFQPSCIAECSAEIPVEKTWTKRVETDCFFEKRNRFLRLTGVGQSCGIPEKGPR